MEPYKDTFSVYIVSCKFQSKYFVHSGYKNTEN